MNSQHKTRSRGLGVALMAPLLVLTLGACESLLEVDIPGSVTEDALNDVKLAETLALSAQGDFECGFVDYMRFPGQWFEEFQNSSQSRPDALVGLRSQLVWVYADPCDSGTGPIWGTIQLPRQQGQRAVNLIQGFEDAEGDDFPQSHYLKSLAALYEAYSMQLLGEQFCYVTFDGGPYMTRTQTYAAAETRFTFVMTEAQTSIDNGVRVADAEDVLTAARIGRARARMYQGDTAGALADAQFIVDNVDPTYQRLATYDSSPGRRRNRLYEINTADDAMMTHRWYTELGIDATTGLTISGSLPLQGAGDLDPRVPIEYGPELDPRGFTPYRKQVKYNSNGADIPFSTYREAVMMVAELDPAQTVSMINYLRSNTDGLPSGIDAEAWPLTPLDAGAFAGLSAADQTRLIQEERRRELWIQGVQAGDKLRTAYPPFETQDEYGQALGDGTCMPVPNLEVNANSNPYPG